MGGLSSLAGGISDVVGGIGDIVEDNAGAIIGGIVAYNTFGAAYGFGLSAGLGSAAGSYVQHGDTGRAIGDGLMGATVGSIAAPTVSATGGGAVSNAGPNTVAPPQPSGQSFMNQTSGGAVTPDTEFQQGPMLRSQPPHPTSTKPLTTLKIIRLQQRVAQ